MTKIFIRLQSDSELITYEGMALALVLSSFDYHVQLWLAPSALAVVQDPTSRLHGMIKSAPLYDLPPIWLDDLSILHTADDDIYDKELLTAFCQTPHDANLSIFDSQLVF